MVHTLQVSNQISTEKQILTRKCRAETETALKLKRRPKRSLRACFLSGSNSTCRGHIASHHFEEYEKRCKNATPSIKLNYRCIPEAVRKSKEQKGKSEQQTLLKFSKAKEFMRGALLDAVAKLIACDDQVSLGVRF
jgi:hypothetical protein